MKEDKNIERYIFIDDIQELFQIKGATTTSWLMKFTYKNPIDESSIFIITEVDKTLKIMPFNKFDLKNIRKIYQLIRIYFNNNLYENFICKKRDNKDNILFKISNFPLLVNMIMKNLNINQNSLNNFAIIEKNLIVENFDKVYDLVLNKNNVALKFKPKTQDILSSNDNLTRRLIDYNSNKFKDQYNTYICSNNFNNNMNNPFNNQMNNNQMMNAQWLKNNQIINEQMIKNNQIMLQNMNIMNQNFKNNFQFNNNLIPSNVPQSIGNNNISFNNPSFQINNNQLLNSGNIIDYNAFIEKNANLYFKHVLNKGIEKKYFSKTGLNNVGLTCYMNSTLQCLLHVPELTCFFINSYSEFEKSNEGIIKKTETQGKICAEYNYIISNIFKDPNKKAFSPKYFNDLISKLNPQFAKYESNDAKDLIIYLLQEMHEELNYFGGKNLENIPKCNQLIEADSFNFFFEINSKLNFSIISYLFWGIVKQITTCKSCNQKLYNFQYYQYLSFPLYKYAHQKFNLYRGLQDYISEERLSGENQFYCQICKGLRDASIYSKIYYTSPYLLINFDYGKNKKYVPNDFIFGEIIVLNEEFLSINTSKANYQLIAVSSHIGSSGNTGHYITFCKDTTFENSWYEYNDSSVRKCSFDSTKNYSPYLLLYKKEVKN